ncbi:hypothetical protein FIBSPDRAFT_955510 [Athelia psychrophila]|uniref:Uncharacterized protein n=1 Tax=Athelia psychrophila TaxID=1759441 RepID=A0A166HZI3_9AGAM|nr:hypothetical protein FIBSPDRAFT_955510 [Fibularhizoctonia sp. CBS 109695]
MSVFVVALGLGLLASRSCSLESDCASQTIPGALKLGSSSSLNGNAPYRKANDVFTMLASAPGTSSKSRSITPSSMKPSMSGSNIPANGKPITPPLSKPTNRVAAESGDAFSNLVSGSMAGSNGANTTIAQRAALVDSQRRDAAMLKMEASRKQSSLSARVLPSQSQSSWDLDEFTSPSASAPPKPKAAPRSTTNSLARDFDFGDQKDGLLREDERAFGEGNKYRRNDDGDDILGMLSKPITSAGKRPSPEARSVQEAEDQERADLKDKAVLEKYKAGGWQALDVPAAPPAYSSSTLDELGDTPRRTMIVSAGAENIITLRCYASSASPCADTQSSSEPLPAPLSSPSISVLPSTLFTALHFAIVAFILLGILVSATAFEE